MGQPLKFWAEDNIQQVSAKKLGREAESPTLREVFAEFVTHAYQQEGNVFDLTRENRELKEAGRELTGRLEILTFNVDIRDELLAVSPERLEEYIAHLGEELKALRETDIPVGEVEARKREAGIVQLEEKMSVAEGSLKVIGPFVEQLAKTTDAVERGAEELEAAQKKFEEAAEVLQEQIRALKRDGIPAHTDRIDELMQALLEKTDEFTQLGLKHEALLESAREAEEQLGGQVKDLAGQLEGARQAQDVAELALNKEQRANEDFGRDQALRMEQLQRDADEKLALLREELRVANLESARLTERVRVLELVPGVHVQDKADMLDRIAVDVLGMGPDLGQLEARVGVLKEAEGRLGQLYDLAHIPRGGGAFDALAGMIQAVARIFTTWGRGDAQSLAGYAAHFEPHVAEINRKAGEYAGVVIARDNAVQDLAREQAESRKLLSILGNGFSWSWNTATVVPSYIYDAMRF